VKVVAWNTQFYQHIFRLGKSLDLIFSISMTKSSSILLVVSLEIYIKIIGSKYSNCFQFICGTEYSNLMTNFLGKMKLSAVLPLCYN